MNETHDNGHRLRTLYARYRRGQYRANIFCARPDAEWFALRLRVIHTHPDATAYGGTWSSARDHVGGPRKSLRLSTLQSRATNVVALSVGEGVLRPGYLLELFSQLTSLFAEQ